MKNIQQGRQNFILRVQKSSFLRIIFLWKLFSVQVFVCWLKLFPSSGRIFH